MPNTTQKILTNGCNSSVVNAMNLGMCKKVKTNEPFLNYKLNTKSGKKVRTKVFNWSEVHFYRSNFLQNPYFSNNTSMEFLEALQLQKGSLSRPEKLLDCCCLSAVNNK